MIEQVAKAMRRNRFLRTGRLASFDENMPPTEVEIDDARAAIAALREPNEAMMAAANEVNWLTVEWAQSTVDEIELWHAMIDAMLSPERGKVEA